MPLRPAILRDPVDQVAAKLSSPNSQSNIVLSSWVLQQAKERFRILETRVANGKLGKLDRPENRAAVLIAHYYAARDNKASGNCPPPNDSATASKKEFKMRWKDIAAAVGTKPSNLERLDMIISNYLQQPSQTLNKRKTDTPSSSSLIGANKRQTRSSLIATSANSTFQSASTIPHESLATSLNTVTQGYHPNPTSVAGGCSHLADLVIRLAAKIPDPHHAVKRARNLLHDITHYIQTQTNPHDRRGYLYDLRRFAAAYEAACLYVVVTKNHSKTKNQGKPRQSQLKSTNSRKRSREAAVVADKDDDEIDDPDALRNANNATLITLHDLADASSEFTYLELYQVLPEVNKLADQAEEAKQQQHKVKATTAKCTDGSKLPAAHKAGDSTSQTVQKADAETNNRVSKKRKAVFLADSSLVTKNMEVRSRNDNTNDDGVMSDEQTDSDSPSFLFDRWRQEVLSNAIFKAKEAKLTSPKDDNAEGGSEVADELALAWAADDILRKHGLLQLQG